MKKLALLSATVLLFAPVVGLIAAQNPKGQKAPKVGKSHHHSHHSHHSHHHHSHHHHTSSSDFERTIGTFPIIGFAKDGSVQLSNTVIYKPVNKRYKKEVSNDWSAGDSVLVVRSDHEHIYILTDLTTNQVIKATILNLD